MYRVEYRMSDEPNFILIDQDAQEQVENGVYDCQTTREDRYTNPDSNDYIIYENLSDPEWREKTYRILDIGSSSGEALNSLVNQLEDETDANFEAYALDINWGELENAQENNLNTIRAKSQSLPFKEDSFDIVISANLYLGSKDIDVTVEEIDRVLKPSRGKAVLSQGYEEQGYVGLHIGSIER